MFNIDCIQYFLFEDVHGLRATDLNPGVNVMNQVC